MPTININHVTRIEGHASITIHLDDDGKVTDTQFHVTQIRGFEKFVEGRPYYEMPAITSRICGICPVSHLLAASKACDAIMAVRIPQTAAKLRELMHMAQIVQSHALSFFHLSAPDLLLGMDSDPAKRNVAGLLAEHPAVVLDGVKLRKFGQQVIERLGKYAKTLNAGFHILVPFLDRVAYKHSLKEQTVDVPPQTCITRDNISVEVDGVLYLQVVDPVKASYGIEDYLFALSQLAQTTMRSEIGKLELDRTFEERMMINHAIIEAVDKASDPWGVKVTRYEIKNIHPPQSVKDALEKQMRAEREKRAAIAESEGDREAKINVAEGTKQEAIKNSEGEKMKRINEAEGRSKEIELVAIATAEGIRKIAEAIEQPSGSDAVNLRVAEQYIKQFGNLAKEGNTLIIPSNLSEVGGMVAAATSLIKKT